MLLVVAYKMVALYLKLAIELKRLELVSQSPLISTVVEFYNGLSVVRRFGKVDYQRARFRKHVDRITSVFLHERYAVVFMLMVNGSCMIAFILVSFMLISTFKLHRVSFLPQDINFISVTLTWVLIIPSFIEIFCFKYLVFIENMSSVERLLFNVDERSSEGPLKAKPAPEFDESKGIRFSNVYSRYRDGLPFVLQGLSLHIQPGQKVALVGRTGSGKSSVILALTRLLNVQNSPLYPRVRACHKPGVPLSR